MDEAIKLTDLKAGIKTVSVGWRFLHYLVDIMIIQLIAYIIVLAISANFNSILLVVIFPLYYILFEYLLQRTPGKYISRTIVIDEYGNKPNLPTIILRTLIRYIPIEPLSCLDDNSRGWHDSWSKTYVIKKSYLPTIEERIRKIENGGA